MDAVNEKGVHTIAVMASSQVGKTESLNNILGYFIHGDPSPMMVVMPTLDGAQEWSKDRLMPMVRDSPVLSSLIGDARSRTSESTILHKKFPGGQLSIVGSNSPAGLAARPVRVVLQDEIDRYEASAGGEGDPVKLADRRTETFWRAVRVRTSTPTIRHGSRIETEYERSDRRRFYVPCGDCGEHQVLVWSQVRWPKDSPEDARYVCEHCGSAWDDATRWRNVSRGEWRATAPFTGVAGFHLWAAYSSWVKLGDKAVEFLEAKRHPEQLKTFVNTVLGETWEDEGQGVSDEGLMARREPYDADTVPDQVRVVTLGVDVQKDRLEVSAIGWGTGEEAWVIEHVTMYGDPSRPVVWGELEDYVTDTFVRQDGTGLRAAATAVDSGGHYTSTVIRFCERLRSHRVWAVKGIGFEGRPLWPRQASRSRKTGGRVFLVGVDTAKEAIYSRLNRVEEPGEGYIHFPASVDREYFDQLTAEQMRTEYHLGRAKHVWVKTRPRNEALDCFVYAYAALHGRRVRLDAEPSGEGPRRRHRSGGFVLNWS